LPAQPSAVSTSASRSPSRAFLTPFVRRSTAKGPPIWTAFLAGSLIGAALLALSWWLW
jgi:hypothetical protein